MRRPTEERRKLTFKKCHKRYDLFNHIIVGGSEHDAQNIHRYAKGGMDFIKYENESGYCVRDLKMSASARDNINDYLYAEK